MTRRRRRRMTTSRRTRTRTRTRGRRRRRRKKRTRGARPRPLCWRKVLSGARASGSRRGRSRGREGVTRCRMRASRAPEGRAAAFTAGALPTTPSQQRAAGPVAAAVAAAPNGQGRAPKGPRRGGRAAASRQWGVEEAAAGWRRSEAAGQLRLMALAEGMPGKARRAKGLKPGSDW